MVKGKLIVGEEPFLAYLKHTNFELRYHYEPVEKVAPIICPSCKQKHSLRWIKHEVNTQGITRRAVLVDKMSIRNEKLVELNRQVQKKKLSPRGFFETEERILRVYSSLPKDEQPILSATSRIALKCKNCDYPLGSIEVRITSKIERPMPPDAATIVGLPKTPKEKRWIRERFAIKKDMSIEEWLEGGDIKPKIEELKRSEKVLAEFPFIRKIYPSIADLRARTHTVIEKLKTEIQTRKNQVYNLLAVPPVLFQYRLRQLEKAPDEEREKEIRRFPGIRHVPSELVQDMLKRGKLTKI